MRFAFIGAGKVGVTLGKYLSQTPQCTLSGYYSRHYESAKKAADYTNSDCFTDIQQLINLSDALFLTVPDSQIAPVYEEIKHYDISGKQIIHCSGSLSADVFYDAEEKNAAALSIHPLYAFSQPYQDNPNLSQAVVTIEGGSCRGKKSQVKYMEDAEGRQWTPEQFWKNIFSNLGNTVVFLDSRLKTKYHAAAVMSSNLVLGLLDCSVSMLEECGFTEKEALQAIRPLTTGNMDSAFLSGLSQALTGPVERGDVETIRKHLNILQQEPEDLEKIYRLLSRRALSLAKIKNRNRDYNEIEESLK